MRHQYEQNLSKDLGHHQVKQAAEAEDRFAASAKMIYFIGAEQGPIKIGISFNPAARCAELQTAYPYRLRVLAICPGGEDMEKALHRKFSNHRLNGEWFERAPDVLNEIKRINAVWMGEAFTTEVLPPEVSHKPTQEHSNPMPAVQKMAYSVPEVAQMLGLSIPTIWRFISQGKLQKRKLGRRTVITPNALNDLLAGGQ